jgi:hypothetical protein
VLTSPLRSPHQNPPFADRRKLPSVSAVVNYSVPIEGHAIQDVLRPENTHIPLESHTVTVRDARSIRDELDLDKEGFVLLDFQSQTLHC